ILLISQKLATKTSKTHPPKSLICGFICKTWGDCPRSVPPIAVILPLGSGFLKLLGAEKTHG
ncbi:MAG TPA: hypothetical protein VEZ50_01960, partial [Nodosilinea sp.]|nr:hypothetical protein [Nodosilinea sp.]